MLSGCETVRRSPEVQLTVNGCPKVTQCRLEKSSARTNGDLLTAADEAEEAWAICADKVDVIIACQERNSEQASILTPRAQ
ncbi:Rz1-like lysis system protein LysC [Kluyvera georgiana]|uniref:Rz1-like lysis system protein LysC n=1 Tax=Kluyvera georgiana TaxID=73098 RepID=UPI003220563B